MESSPKKVKSEVQFKPESQQVVEKKKFPSKPKKPKPRPEKPPESHLKTRFADCLTAEQEASLRKTAKFLMEPGKGILAADDSIRQLDSKLRKCGLEPREDNRRRYNEVLLGGGPVLSNYLSGVLVKEEAVRQLAYMGKRLLTMIKEAGVKLGIRADNGVVPLYGTPGEWSTQGLDGLEEACKRYRAMGAEFALWRCVYSIGPFTPTTPALIENSTTLARFASVCQSCGLVPIVSPEVLMTGQHDSATAQMVMKDVLTFLMKALSDYHIYSEGLILRMSVVCPVPLQQPSLDVGYVGNVTLKAINESLSPALGGIVIASLENLDISTRVLNGINKCPAKKPTFISFCFSNVIQDGVMELWDGQDKNVERARETLLARLKLCCVAAMGQFQVENSTFFVINITKY